MDLGVSLSGVYGKSRVFGLFHCVLTISVLVLSPTVCVSVHAIGISVWSPQVFDSFERHLAASIGKFGGLSFF